LAIDFAPLTIISARGAVIWIDLRGAHGLKPTGNKGDAGEYSVVSLDCSSPFWGLDATELH
jgi:hypothetical protein